MYHPQKKPKGRQKKMFLYSGHDTTVSAFLSALNIFDVHQPPYTAAVIVELHHVVIEDNGEDENEDEKILDFASQHQYIVKVELLTRI